jgi:WD40 repeat protein
VAAAVPGGRPRPLTILLTLRSDFLGQAPEHAGLAKLLGDATFLIGQMTRDQLRQVITGPLTGGTSFEAGLVERILDDVGEEPGNLPLLEFALTLLWECQEHGTLTHAGYEALGGVDGAIARYAEQVYLEELSEADREIARRLLVQLVEPAQSAAHVRRVARRTELDPARWRLAQRLATARLLVAGRDPAEVETVELVHEALIEHWDRLRHWAEADRGFRAWQERLRGSIAAWHDSGHDTGALLRGGPLGEAEGWLQQRAEDLVPAERDFITASRAFSRDGRCGACARSPPGWRSCWWRRWSSGCSPSCQPAGQRTPRRRPSGWCAWPATAATRGAYSPPAGGRRRGRLQPGRRAHAGVGRRRRHRVLGRRAAGAGRQGGRAGVSEFAWSPDGRVLASGGSLGEVRLWDALRRRELGRPLRGAPDDLRGLTFSPDGRRLAACGGAEIVLWDLRQRSVLDTIRVSSPNNCRAGFAAGGRQLIFAAGGSIITWDIGRRPSPDGRWLAVDSSSGVELWDVQARRPVTTLARHSDAVFSPDSRLLAASVGTSEVAIWRVAGLARIATLDAGVPSDALRFSPDSQLLATSGDGVTLQRFDARWAAQHLCAILGRDLTRQEWDDRVRGRAYQPACS